MKKTTRHIYIFEGPSGSGKTTFLKTLEGMGVLSLVKPPIELPRPRAYEDSDNGIRLSALKDLVHLWTAVANDLPKQAIDRGYLSQLVYGSIRLGHDHPMTHGISLLKSQISMLLEYSRGDLYFRGSTLGIPETRVHFIWYLPSVEVIEDRRAHSTNREYAYPTEIEHRFYSELWNYLPDFTPRMISNLDDESRFIQEVQHVL